MKNKLFIVFIVLNLIISVSACSKSVKNTETTKALSSDNVISQDSTQTSDAHNSSSVIFDSVTDDNGGGYIESAKYRQCYYQIPYHFTLLVDDEEYQKWKNEIYIFNSDKMKIISFIQYFDITKEEFEKTNLALAADFVEWGEKPTMRPLDYENQQTYEVYNADIIYTFDDEIINEYYLTPDYPYCAEFEYENAIANGTYQTQTTDWIDLAQMEAEINAKYGEPEVTETTTTVDEA